MPPFANILVATDFSNGAARAVDRAARLAHAHQATLHMVHVMDRLLLKMFAGSIDEHPLATEQRLLDSAREQLKEQARLVAGRFGVPVKDEVLIGRVALQMAQYAQAQAIDLNVFGAHGENFLRDLFVGSTASRFLCKGHQPTLIVRSEQDPLYRRLLVAVDSSPASRLAIESAMRIAPRAAIHVLHVSELAFEGKMRFAGIGEGEIAVYRSRAESSARRTLDAFLDGIDGAQKLPRSVIDGTPSRTIVAEAESPHADLVVMGKRGQFELDEFLLGSAASRVLEAIDRDLLLVAPA
jgi:universal stress protein E